MGFRNALWKERDELIYIFVYNVVNFVSGACDPSGVGDSSAARNASCAREAGDPNTANAAAASTGDKLWKSKAKTSETRC